MFHCLKSYVLFAVVCVSVGGVAQTATATDRFDVIVEIVSFKSLVDMDPSNGNDEYYLTVHADVPGAGRRSIYNHNLNGAPKRTHRLGRQVTFRNVKDPSRSQRTIRLSCDVSEKDVVKKKGKIFEKPKQVTTYDDMGAAQRSTTSDLFREADRSRNDLARETVWLSNRNYRMEIRVTVVEVD